MRFSGVVGSPNVRGATDVTCVMRVAQASVSRSSPGSRWAYYICAYAKQGHYSAGRVWLGEASRVPCVTWGRDVSVGSSLLDAPDSYEHKPTFAFCGHFFRFRHKYECLSVVLCCALRFSFGDLS